MRIQKVQVEVKKKRGFVEPEATFGDFDAVLQAHALVIPVGINSTTPHGTDFSDHIKKHLVIFRA